jgi:hypothetical protein
LNHFLTLFYRTTNFEAAGAAVKIDPSLKLNHHKQLLLAQIIETHCSKKSKRHFLEINDWMIQICCQICTPKVSSNCILFPCQKIVNFISVTQAKN